MRNSIFLALSIGLTACQSVVTLNQVVPDSLAATDDRLLGTWQEESESTRVTVRRVKERAYEFAYTDKDGRPQLVQGLLGRQGSRLVLDLSAGPDSRWPRGSRHHGPRSQPTRS